MVCANHQSNLDPVVVGCVLPRPTNFLAKDSLFKGLLGWHLRNVDGIPLDRDGASIGGMKETLKRLKRNESVVLFPEGTRSNSDKMLPLKPGFVVLVRRVKLPVVPIGIAGTREAWAPGTKFPKLGRVCAVFGDPILPEEFSGKDDAEMVALLTDRIQICVNQARSHRDGEPPNQ